MIDSTTLDGTPLPDLQAAYEAQIKRTAELAKSGQFANMPKEQQRLQQLKRALGSARHLAKKQAPDA